MFIGGLNWDTTDGIYVVVTFYCSAKLVSVESLRNYFSQFGKVDACTIMRDAAGRSRCFAFLTFEEPASVNAVMVREHFLDGKIVSIVQSTNRRPQSYTYIC
jgi:RNA-binding protein Musashi